MMQRASNGLSRYCQRHQYQSYSCHHLRNESQLFPTNWSRRKFSSTNKRQHSQQQQQQQQQDRENASSENIFGRFQEWYTKKLSTHPLLTKSITGGIIAGGGDFVCQVGIEENEGHPLKEWDPARTSRFAFLGAFFVSPSNHIWYKLLAKKMAPGTTIPQVTKRVLWDQFTWTPVYTAIWLSSLWYLEGTEPQEIKSTLQREYMGVMYANWVLWIPAQFANFRLIPLKFQVLFVNVVELVWNAYLSFCATGKGDDEESGNARKNRMEKQRKLEEKREAQQEKHLARSNSGTPAASQV